MRAQRLATICRLRAVSLQGVATRPHWRHSQLPSLAVPQRSFATGRGDVEGGSAGISETEFHAKADVSLQGMHDAVDAGNLDCIDDLGYEDGVLTVKLESGKSFVINKHYATRQIWYASPVTGALYFSYQGDGTWRTTNSNVELAPLVGYAFKIQDHAMAGQVTYMRVYQGKISKGDQIVNMMSEKRLSVKRLVRMHSNEVKDVSEASAGDIVALAGMECESGVTFTDGKAKVTCSSMFVPDSVMSLSVTASRDDQARFQKALAQRFEGAVASALRRFQREDPTFRVEQKQDTNETIISGMGELHLEVYCERMRREFKANLRV
eukprot:s1347_g8.t1